MHARRHRMNRVQKRDIISDIFGGGSLPTLSIPPIIHKPTETSSSASQSSTSVTLPVVTSSTESSSSSPSSVSASSTSSTSSTVSSTSSTSSQTPIATPPPSSTIEQPSPSASTSTLVVQASATASPSQNPSTVGSGSNATGFLHNKVASGVVFALVGLIGLVLIFALVTFAVRAKRKAKLHKEAISFEPTIQPEALDNYSDEKGQRRTPSPTGNSHENGYYQQTNAAFQRPGYDFGAGNHSQQYYPGGPIQLPSALYGSERARDAHPGHWNSGMASSSI